MKNYFPINLDLNNKKCLVVGAGQVAFRKIRILLNYNPKIKIIAKEIKSEKLLELINEKKVKYKKKPFDLKDVKKYFLVICATDNIKLNEKISNRLIKKNVLANNATGNGNVNFPAIYNDGNLTISVSTNGESPMMAKKIRDNIGNDLSGTYSKIIELFSRFKKKLKKEICDKKVRNEIYKKINEIDINDDFINIERKLENIYLELIKKVC